ncbi:MAG: elongation factor P maturation arginine rhamnosyltransferase EarP [Neisseria sp.]|nr:elongation factor P maturation arginine rhamnosyltransferase EarP [Neisseria sp.]
MAQIASPPTNTLSIWIFCRVIDNFGDAGVACRLANVLQAADCSVRLFIDDLPTLAALQPQLNLDADEQHLDGVQISRWSESLTLADTSPAPDCIIEMFACELPTEVRKIIQKNNSLWLNWEYLTAEDWAEELHLMPSPQADGTQKYFYFMGFGEKSGGLLRETHLPMNANLSGSLKTLRLFAFGYAAPLWADWLHCWERLDKPLTLTLAGGQVVHSLQHTGLLPHDALNLPDETWHTGSVELRRAPFVAQSAFDELLQRADVLMVRGEDSFVRAQYAAKPFFWHIYPQAEQAHVVKLHAFWERVYPYFPPALMAAHRALSDELNGVHTLSDTQRLRYWQDVLCELPAWTQAMQAWREHLFRQPAAQTKLISLIREKRLK